MLFIFLFSSCLCVIALFCLFYLLYHGINILIKVFRIPGPPTYPIVGNMLDILVSTEKLWKVLIEWGEKYPIYRLWCSYVPSVFVCNPNDIEVILSSSKNIRKSGIYRMLEPWLGKGLLTSTGTKWQNRRKILTPAFHFNILQEFMNTFIEQSTLLVNKLENECNKQYSDIVPIIKTFTLHSICETAMGTRIDEKTEFHKSYVGAIYKMGEILIHRLLRPWLYVNCTYICTPEYRERNSVSRFLHKMSMQIIQERKNNFNNDYKTKHFSKDDTNQKKRLAMLDLLISAQTAGEDIDDEGIREEVDTFMFEGYDTTAMSICFTLFLLANHPDVQNKVVQEIEDTFESFNADPTYQDLQNLTYLEMVIKESLRMYPSVPIISRAIDEKIITPSGYEIPKYLYIHIHIYGLHHNSEIYPDPYKFDPDRFLPENTQSRHPFAFIPFSAGPRNCIGQRFAMLEMKCAISAILRRFILIPIDSLDDVTLITDMIIRPKNGINIKFKPRTFLTQNSR